VWARPELDRYCDDGGRAYFVRSVPSATYDGSGGPSGFGCEARFTGTLVEVGGADPPCGAVDVVGQTFCCPPSLLAPSAPASGNGPTCRQILYDYLEEQGVDPRVKNPELAGAKGPSFDASTSVLARGNLIDQCDVDPHAVVEVCAAVRNGAAQGVSVCVQPSDAGAAQCIARAVRALGFPKRERMDFTETAFDPRGKR